MVGVEYDHEVSEAQMDWLKSGGRNKIERMADRFMKIWKKAGKTGDFFVTIFLPTDILVIARNANGIGRISKFDYNKMKQAEELRENIKKSYSDVETLITTAKEYWALGDLAIMVNETWHGNEAQLRGWEYCSTIYPPGLFP
jgi:hypothetical protein